MSNCLEERFSQHITTNVSHRRSDAVSQTTTDHDDTRRNEYVLDDGFDTFLLVITQALATEQFAESLDSVLPFLDVGLRSLRDSLGNLLGLLGEERCCGLALWRTRLVMAVLEELLSVWVQMLDVLWVVLLMLDHVRVLFLLELVLMTLNRRTLELRLLALLMHFLRLLRVRVLFQVFSLPLWTQFRPPVCGDDLTKGGNAFCRSLCNVLHVIL